MSLYDFYESKEILDNNPTFAALIMAAAEKAQTVSGIKLKEAFPRIVGESRKRCSASQGLLDGDGLEMTCKYSDGRTETFKRTYGELNCSYP